VTYLSIALAVFCLYLIWQLHGAQKSLTKEREQLARERRSLQTATALERANLSEHFDHERQLLLNRIQAPEIAVAQAQVAEADGEPKHIPFDDDKAWEDFVEEHTGGFAPEGID
jgi:hypothetical protein